MTRMIDIPETDKTVTIGSTEIKIAARLVGVGDPRAKGWDKSADHWRVTLTCGKNKYEIDYRTGTGLRKYPTVGYIPKHRGHGAPSTIAHEENEAMKQPVHPDAKGVLWCLALDLSTSLEMPRDDAAALDYLDSEFGSEGKASEQLELIRALRRNHDGLAILLRGSGLTLEQFAEFREE